MVIYAFQFHHERARASTIIKEELRLQKYKTNPRIARDK